MNLEIGSYEAKTKLPELLRGVQAGKRYTITLRGEPIADLIPAEGAKQADAAAAVDAMRQFMRAAPAVEGIDLKALINEGRASSFVLDNSVAMCWLLADGKPADVAYAEAVLDALREQQALVPSLWALEASNVIARAEAKGLLSRGTLAGLPRPPAATQHRDRSRHRSARLGRHPAPGPALQALGRTTRRIWSWPCEPACRSRPWTQISRRRRRPRAWRHSPELTERRAVALVSGWADRRWP